MWLNPPDTYLHQKSLMHNFIFVKENLSEETGL